LNIEDNVRLKRGPAGSGPQWPVTRATSTLD